MKNTPLKVHRFSAYSMGSLFSQYWRHASIIHAKLHAPARGHCASWGFEMCTTASIPAESMTTTKIHQ